MKQMVRVLEADWPKAGYMAEVPGLPGLYVQAPSIPELRAQLRAAMADPEGARFAISCRQESRTGYSETAVFVTL